MKSEQVIDRVRRDLHRVLDNVRAELDRIEILTAAISAFSRPVPDYEPAFQHIHSTKLSAHQIG